MVVGTVLLSGWGGPKRRIFGVAVGDMLTGLFVALMGISPSFIVIALGGFLIGISGPIANGSNQALWQSKVAADVQGRVFAGRRLIAFSIIPLAYLLAGPLADQVFRPALMPGGALADTVIGKLIGVGPGRGVGAGARARSDYARPAPARHTGRGGATPPAA
jgi:hypothetical protein